MTARDRTSLIERLLPAVHRAGDVILEVHAEGRAAGNVASKGDGSPVTEADLRANAILVDALQDAAPDIPVVSEEEAASHSTEAAQLQRFFLVDPLDGTKEFLKADGQGAFTVNVALIENGQPTLGIVLAPALKRLFLGNVGVSASETFDQSAPKPLQIRSLPATGAIAVASASHRDAETDAWLRAHGISETVSIGSSLKFCLVAAGEADVYPRFGPTMEWDTAAGHAVLMAAGGQVVNPDGTPFTYAKPAFRNGSFIGLGDFTLSA